MSAAYNWCQDKTRLAIWDKQVFCVKRCGSNYWYKRWYLNNKLHRENGPAIEYANGTKSWWLNGKRHRENGPAIEYPNGSKWWYLNGIEYSESAYWKELYK